MNFEVFIPSQQGPVDNCHYVDGTLTQLECNPVVDPYSTHGVTDCI